MDGCVGFAVARGVWHWPAFPLTTATQLVDLRRNTEYWSGWCNIGTQSS